LSKRYNLTCSQIDICSRSGCCKFNCDASCDLKDEYGSSGHPTLRALRNAAEAQNPGSGIDVYPPVYVNKSLTDYWNCITRKNNYDLYPKNECGENCCCANPCDKYRAEGILTKLHQMDNQDLGLDRNAWQIQHAMLRGVHHLYLEGVNYARSL
jgi:hypothetical protein